MKKNREMHRNGLERGNHFKQTRYVYYKGHLSYRVFVRDWKIGCLPFIYYGYVKDLIDFYNIDCNLKTVCSRIKKYGFPETIKYYHSKPYWNGEKTIINRIGPHRN